MVCTKLYTSFLTRLKPPPLLEQAAMFFDHDDYDWFVNKGEADQSDDEGKDEDSCRDMGSSQSPSNN